MARKPIRKTLPESLCNLLRQIREVIFDNEEKVAFADRLKSNIRVPGEGFTINRNVVTDIEARRHKFLQYEHLETYAHTVGVPMGVLCLVSRYQYTPLEEAERVVQGLEVVVREARESGRDKLTVEDLRRLGAMINVPTTGARTEVTRDDMENETDLARLSRHRKRLGDRVDDLISDTALWRKEPIDPPGR